MRNVWEEIKRLISDTTGISVGMVDLLAVKEILFQCVSGLSVSHIANYVDQDEKYVREVLEDFLGFGGWTFDLDFSPISCYNRSNNMEEFMESVKSFSPLTTKFVAIMAYEQCERYKELERKLEND